MRQRTSIIKGILIAIAIVAPLCLTVLAMSEEQNAYGSTAKDSSGLTKVTIQIDGAATPYYAPLYLAEQYGYFEDEGLDVEFYYASAAEIVKNVAAQNVTFGFPNSDTVVMGRANDVPVNIIHTTYQSSLGSVLFKKSSGIETPQDLRGKTIAVTSFGSPNYIQLQVILEEAGLTLDDVTVKIIGTGGIVNALATDQVDAICFSMLRAYDLEAQGVEIGEFRAEDYLPGHGNVVIASEAFLNEHPDVCVSFVNALNRALSYILDGHIQEAVELSIEAYAPSSRGSEDRIVHVIEEEFVNRLWQSADTASNGYGYSNAQRYQRYIDILAQYRIIEAPYDASRLIVNLSEVSADE